jgi:long-chain acyl-CoA synthetase
VTFRGVHKAMFTRSGFNVYPREIERVVARLDGVRTARVRAIPNAAREHDIGLEVEGSVTEDAVHRWCSDNLSAYKQPSVITIV